MSGSTGAVVSSIRSAVRSSRQAKPKAVHPVTAKRAFSTSNRLSVEGDAAESSTSRSATSSSSSAVEAGETHEEAWKRNMKEVREWRRRKESQRSKLPLFLPPYVKSPPSPSPLRLSLSTLLASGAALGHSSSSLSPAFMPYTYGTRSGLSIIDLDQTLPILRRTAAMIRDVVRQDGVVLVVGSRTGHERLLRRARERMGDSVYTVEEWMPGTLTNSVTFFGVEPMTKKSHLPDIAIFLNPSENLGAIRECTAKNVPTVGIVDSDTDPRIVTYPIPANMESIRTAELILSTLSIAGEEGRRLLQYDRQEKLRKARENEARRVAKQKEASNLRDR